MYEKEFSQRLSQLRADKGVSARDMSLSLGQNAGYINNIETGKALPSMSNFFTFVTIFKLLLQIFSIILLQDLKNWIFYVKI